ncbi:c-type cytochrome [Bdellovibrio sp. HCB2-146]|uniref:c-type cytochrome n=1 Tax=Bdellovibrio sp. HCB2-146 TaxID=3394362 RepID=UPI0039BD5BFD
MRTKNLILLSSLLFATTAVTAMAISKGGFQKAFGKNPPARATDIVEEGREIFRHDTFGSETFWGDKLRLHHAIIGEKNGGVGAGVSPKAALAVGLKVDIESLSQATLDAIKNGTADLDDPNTSIVLLKEDAIIGVKGFFNDAGQMTSIGVQCALCHSTVDNSLAPGLGKRLDGWPNRDLNVGAIVSLSPDLSYYNTLLGVDDATTRTVLSSWGPGRYDPILFLDGKAFRPDGKTAATLLPAAYGLMGVNLHTSTGWGSVTYWNAFVANLQMHGQGTFYDPRLDDANKYPIAAREKMGHIKNADDKITSKLAALHAYQLALTAPAAPAGSFDEAMAKRGQVLFNDKAKCATCHTPPLYSEPGWNMHTGAEIGIDEFQAMRSPAERYRTTPLKGAWARAQGGYYHDGRFANLGEVVEHYNGHLQLSLTDAEKADLVEFLKSL